jgi:hypothetical protein
MTITKTNLLHTEYLAHLPERTQLVFIQLADSQVESSVVLAVNCKIHLQQNYILHGRVFCTSRNSIGSEGSGKLHPRNETQTMARVPHRCRHPSCLREYISTADADIRVRRPARIAARVRPRISPPHHGIWAAPTLTSAIPGASVHMKRGRKRGRFLVHMDVPREGRKCGGRWRWRGCGDRQPSVT